MANLPLNDLGRVIVNVGDRFYQPSPVPDKLWPTDYMVTAVDAASVTVRHMQPEGFPGITNMPRSGFVRWAQEPDVSFTPAQSDK